MQAAQNVAAHVKERSTIPDRTTGLVPALRPRSVAKAPGLTVALPLLFFPSPSGTPSSLALLLVTSVIWRNQPLWVGFLTCKQDNDVYLRGWWEGRKETMGVEVHS